MSDKQEGSAASDGDGVIHDPELYARLSEPFTDSDSLNDAFRAFTTELRELRIKHGIPDVVAVLGARVLDGGDEVTMCTISQNGDSNRALDLLAWALGQSEREKALRETERLNRLRKGGL